MKSQLRNDAERSSCSKNWLEDNMSSKGSGEGCSQYLFAFHNFKLSTLLWATPEFSLQQIPGTMRNFVGTSVSDEVKCTPVQSSAVPEGGGGAAEHSSTLVCFDGDTCWSLMGRTRWRRWRVVSK
eukprot:223661-Amphidinium_carterae.1